MITTGQLRQIARELIWMTVDKNKVQYDDVRYIKGNGGVFPSRIVKHVNPTTGAEEVKKTPYLPASDTFILFDIVPKDDLASEATDEAVSSMWQFDLVINLYGRDADYIKHYISAVLHAYSVKEWLTSQNISLEKIPSTFAVLDGFENQEWWIRRKMILSMNTAQVVGFDGAQIENDLESLDITIEKAG